MCLGQFVNNSAPKGRFLQDNGVNRPGDAKHIK